MVNMQRAAARTFTGLNVWIYRTSGGRLMGKVRGLPVLLLTVAGRASGTPHTTVLAYVEDAGRYVVSGSAGGAPAEPQWFRNLRHAEVATIEVGPRRLETTVAIADAAEREVLWAQLTSRAPSFAGYQAKIERQIPMAVLTPTG